MLLDIANWYLLSNLNDYHNPEHIGLSQIDVLSTALCYPSSYLVAHESEVLHIQKKVASALQKVDNLPRKLVKIVANRGT